MVPIPKADPTRGSHGDHILQRLYPNEGHYATITEIECARPWSRGSLTWTDMKASRGSLSTLRSSPSAKHELTMPQHYPHYSRRSRGPPSYTMSNVRAAGDLSVGSLLRSSSSANALGSLGSSPSLRSLRLEQRTQARNGPAWHLESSASFKAEQQQRPKTAMQRSASSSKIENWRDPMVAGIGYAQKFYYRG